VVFPTLLSSLVSMQRGLNEIPLQTFGFYPSGGMGTQPSSSFSVLSPSPAPPASVLPPFSATAPPSPFFWPATAPEPGGAASINAHGPVPYGYYYYYYSPSPLTALPAPQTSKDDPCPPPGAFRQRCKKCGSYFTAQEGESDASCVYHPGQYTTPESIGPTLMPRATLRRWSCCKALELDTPGCRQQRHIADPVTSAILSRFDHSAQLREGLVLHEGEDDHALAPKKEERPFPSLKEDLSRETYETKEPVMVRHLVRKTDTLVGLSLRYGVKVDDIKQANKLNTNHSVFAYKYLLIPNPARVPPPEESEESLPKDGKQSIALAQFKAMAHCNQEEAHYYLSEHRYDLKKALDTYRQDLAWEKAAPQPQKVKKVVRAH
jgi:hypothetical protein